MTCCGSIGFKNLTHLKLKLRDRFFPRTNLFRRHFPNKPLQRSSDISWRSIAELGKARIPSMAGKNCDHFIGGQCSSFITYSSALDQQYRGIFARTLSSIHVLVVPFQVLHRRTVQWVRRGSDQISVKTIIVTTIFEFLTNSTANFKRKSRRNRHVSAVK